MRLKILSLTSTFPRSKNDYINPCILELNQNLSDDFDIFVVAPHTQIAKKTERIGKVRVFRFQYFWPPALERLAYGNGIINNLKSNLLLYLQIPFFLLAEYFAAKKIINRKKIDVIHAHWLLPSGLVGLYLKKFYKVPLLITSHGSDINNITGPLGKYILGAVIKKSNFLTVVSRQLKNSAMSLHLKTPTRIITMGVNTALYKPKRKKTKRGKTILLAGRLLEEKGFGNVISALPLILKKIPEVKLFIAGVGQYKDDLVTLAQKLGVQNSVEFLGSIDNKKMPELLNQTDLFIFPSVGREGSPVVILEAGSAGLPIIASKVGGAPEIIIDGKTGILIPRGNIKSLQKEIVALLQNPQKMRKLGHSIRQYIKENYDSKKIAREFKEILTDIAQKK